LHFEKPFATAEQAGSIGVGVCQDATDLNLGRASTSPEIASMPHECPMLSLPRSRPIGFGDFVSGQELCEDLGIDVVAFATALGNHPQLLRMRQD
jgi:hypothetical protein